MKCAFCEDRDAKKGADGFCARDHQRIVRLGHVPGHLRRSDMPRVREEWDRHMDALSKGTIASMTAKRKAKGTTSEWHAAGAMARMEAARRRYPHLNL